ncbi:MAG: cysteine desulfurase NifS [Clostridiales bacterium]|nr:cysteine desulfurase NifS [Clostridiales bacterium]
MSKFVYADHAATTRISDAALAAMTDSLASDWGNPFSLYRLGQAAKEALAKARADVAACLNAAPEEIFFTSGGTESDNWALRGVAERETKKGRHIVTSAIEHHAILHTAQHLEKQGYEVTLLPVDAMGRVSPEALRAALRDDTILVSVMAANNEVGTIQPVKELAAIAHQAGALFHTDAVQAVGHIHVDVKEWGVDLLSLSGHKFHGPRGVGALFIRKGLRLPPLIYGGGQERGHRAGTENVAGVVGMAAALREAVEHRSVQADRLTGLRRRLAAGLEDLPRARMTGDPEHRLPGLASFIFEGIEGESLLLLLDAKGICASTGSACSSTSLEPSHVLLALGLPHEIAHGSLRLSLGKDTTEADVDYVIENVRGTVERLRAMSPIWEERED